MNETEKSVKCGIIAFLSVHDAHCCKVHGCKYGADVLGGGCPVVDGKEPGIRCESCEAEPAHVDIACRLDGGCEMGVKCLQARHCLAWTEPAQELPTPETDAETCTINAASGLYWVRRDFARALERERDAAHRECAHIKEVEFPRRLEAVNNTWRQRAETAERQVERLAGKLDAAQALLRRIADGNELNDPMQMACAYVDMLDAAMKVRSDGGGA